MSEQLVTVAVTTYNSAPFVEETLNSILTQDWPRIELIVSDDASSDATIARAEQWLSQHGSKFESVQVLTVPSNTGVPANCNRIIAAARSNFIKFIAGDDLLLPGCIRNNMNYIQQHPDAGVIFSQVELFTDEYLPVNIQGMRPAQFPDNIMHPTLTAADQYKLQLLCDRISFTPSYFFNRDLILSLGGYDESMKLVEDYPMWLKVTKAGYRLHYFHQPTVAYRQHSRALNNISAPVLFKPLYLKSSELKERYVYPNLPWDLAGAERIRVFFAKLFDKVGLNKDRKITKILYQLITIYLNPYQYIIAIKKRYVSVCKNDIFYR